jgi:hypothetical protein
MSGRGPTLAGELSLESFASKLEHVLVHRGGLR